MFQTTRLFYYCWEQWLLLKCYSAAKIASGQQHNTAGKRGIRRLVVSEDRSTYGSAESKLWILEQGCCQPASTPLILTRRDHSMRILLFLSLLIVFETMAEASDAILTAHSFNAPFIRGPNAANNRNQLENNWKISGTADIHNNFIRLTSEKPSRRGNLFETTPICILFVI